MPGLRPGPFPTDGQWAEDFGVAIVVDAAVVRTLLVPAAMRLMGKANSCTAGEALG